MLEDESGRLRLTGLALQTFLLVTGSIVAVMGTENADGAFEVVDVKIPDLPRQPERWERDEAAIALAGGKVKAERPKSGKIAIVSGLEMGGEGDNAMSTELLIEYLLGEASTPEQISHISRLIIAGNSLAHASPIPPREDATAHKSQKKFGYDSSTYNPVPSELLDSFLAALLPSLPITLLPGASDPAPVSLPQRPLHPALFPHSRTYAKLPTEASAEPSWFDSVTNPWEGDVDGWRLLGNAGQPVDDMFKYVPGDDRLEMMEHLLRWRNGAPTAPDTLCKCFLARVREAPVTVFPRLPLTASRARELPVPGRGPVHRQGVPARLFRRQSASLRDCRCRGPGRPECAPDHDSKVS